MQSLIYLYGFLHFGTPENQNQTMLVHSESKVQKTFTNGAEI